MRRHSIRKKILETILIISLVFGIAVSLIATVQFLVQKHRINVETKEYADTLTDQSVIRLTELNKGVTENITDTYISIVNENFHDISLRAQSLAAYMGALYQQEGIHDAQVDEKTGIMPGVEQNALGQEFSQVRGVREYIATLADYDISQQGGVDIYVVTDSGMCLDGTGDEYSSSEPYPELRNTDWYIGARDSGKPYWSKVLVGEVTGAKRITCSVPFYDGEGIFKGVAAIDLAVEHTYDTALATRTNQVEHALLLDEEGKVMVNPDHYKIDREDVQEGIHDIQGGFESFAIIPETGWTLCLVFQFDMVNQASEKIGGIIIENRAQIDQVMSSTFRHAFIFFLVLIVVGCIIVYLVSSKLSDGLVRPLNRLSEEVAAIGEGNLDHKIEGMDTGDEIGVLADAFNHMTTELQDYIRNLNKLTAEKERIGAELSVATRIQASMLPSIFPAFPERDEIEIYATMEPAKEVGGDFYDFFFVDEHHLVVVMADVSGKGVPAALFMVIAKTLIKNHAQTGAEPSEVFTKVNQQLCKNNQEGFFVTAWLGKLDLRTGELVYVNAGHNPPLVYQDAGGFVYLKERGGFVLAGFEDMQYRQSSLNLQCGDMLYLYTDGVTESENLETEMYGDERLLTKINRIKNLDVKEILCEVKRDIDEFVGEADQFDDITMLMLRLKKCCNDGRKEEDV